MNIPEKSCDDSRLIFRSDILCRKPMREVFWAIFLIVAGIVTVAVELNAMSKGGEGYFAVFGLIICGIGVVLFYFGWTRWRVAASLIHHHRHHPQDRRDTYA